MSESSSTEAAASAAPEKKTPIGDEKEFTPLIRQYWEVKNKNPSAILLFRCGDFYETFFEDAVIAARELQITLTARGKHSGEPIPLAGVPYHSAMNYVSKLVRKGFTVAICEQVEDPKNAKGLVKREVVRILTPGTLSDPSLLEETSNNYLAAFGLRGERFCLASAELSTGEIMFVSGDRSEAGLLAEEMLRLGPRELLLLESKEMTDFEHPPWKDLSTALHTRKTTDQDALEAVCTVYPQEPRPYFQAFPLLELKVLGILAEYLLDTQKCSLTHLRLPAAYRLGDGMLLDEATLRNLELLPDNRERMLGGTLFEVLNRTKTPMGARMLKRWLLKPLTQTKPILERQNSVTVLVDNPLLLAEVREGLDRLPDMERLLTKTVLGGRNPRDMQALGFALYRLPQLRQTLEGSALTTLTERLQPLPELALKVTSHLRDTVPMNLADGGVIADGIHPTLDELRSLMRDGDTWLKTYEEKEKETTGIKTLKVRKNSVFGYYIEISKSVADKAPANYVRKQTLVNGERFITAELKDFESKAFNAHERCIALEKEIFETLVEDVRREVAAVQKTAAAVAELDALASLAHIGSENRFCRPTISDSNLLRIKGGRHPVVESFLPKGEFVPNDTGFTATDCRLAVITGPNMAGKSTYLRQVALIVLLAQVGSYVPAEEADVGIVDRIFTRVGASDNLVRGQSTFMVEMMETAAILKSATTRSLLVLDEIGRGTSTFDGLSLAWAILEHIHGDLNARTLFATHYHELTDLAPLHPGMFNLNVGVFHDEKTGEMLFLHKINQGPSDKSYGIEVARLAGIPRNILDRAKEILFELEKSEEEEIRRTHRAREPRKVPLQLTLFSPENELVDFVRDLEINQLTPLEALNMLARLKDMANG